MKIQKAKVLMSGVITASLVLACGKKSDSETSSTGLTSAETPADLNVSSALKIATPAAITGSTTTTLNLSEDGFGLVANKKSSEACRLGNTINEVTERLESVGNFFCHIETEKDKIKFGKKYKITSKGAEFGRIYIDNSKAADGLITMYMFQDGKLKQKIEITGIDTVRKAAKGTMYDAGSQGTHSWTSSISFDAGFTTDKKMVVTALQKFADSATSGSFARQADMTIFTENTDVSFMKLASKGTWGGQAFKDRGYAKFDGTYGSTVLESEGTNSGQTFSFARINFFDKDGYVAASNASANFASGGTLYLGKSDLPSYLADDFSITAASGWDGSFDETVDLDPDSAAHKACEKQKKHETRDCWGADFGNGETAK